MEKFLDKLDRNRTKVQEIAEKIENKEAYMDCMREYLTSLNEMTTEIMGLIENPQILLDLNVQFYLQVLNDIMYGIENQDSVFLLDVLRYGLLEIYNYIEVELQGREHYE